MFRLFTHRLFASVFILFLCCATAMGQRTQLKPILIKGQTIAPRANAAQWLDSAQHITQPTQILVQFSTIPTAAQQALLAANGLKLVDYIPANAYTALLQPGFRTAAVLQAGVTGIYPVSPLWKADAALWQEVSGAPTASITVIISCMKLPQEIIRQAISNAGGRINNGGFEHLWSYNVTIPASKLHLLASWYGVKYITKYTEMVPLNREAQAANKVNLLALPVLQGGFDLRGEGVTVGIGDNTSGIFHADLYDRIINYNPKGYTNHGVHMNGIVGGAGNIDIRGEGMAPRATLIDHFFDIVLAYTPVMRQEHGMTLTNNSYATNVGNCNYSGVYDVNAVNLDELALEYPDVLHVFASGNDGYLNCSPYPAGFGTVTGGYQPGKNNIVVTSTSKQYVNAFDASRGPVRDGRLKPEISAIGLEVMSTSRTEQYITAGGTSMACPMVTGTLALLTERYRQLHGGANPRADVLKTIIINSSTDIGNPGPDYRYGFGFLNAARAVEVLNNNQYLSNSVINGGQQTTTITVPANTARLKVMLCWHDQPANPMAATQLVNDLDLTVTEPSSTVHQPLILDPTPANILNNATEGVDRLNNCEQVTINNPAAGTYTIQVAGFNIPSGTQGYVISYDMEPVGIQLTYPTGGSVVSTSDSLRIYWDASASANTFSLEFSTNNGANWNTINSSIPATQRYYTWPVPTGTNAAQCRMRLTRNGTSEISTSGDFVINDKVIVQPTANQCAGYVSVSWNGVANATAYEVLRKKGAFMQPVDTVSATSYVIPGLWPDSTYYVAVRPFINGVPGYRGVAISRRADSGSCAGNISDGDLMVRGIVSPTSGRLFTSTALTAGTTLTVAVRNLDDVACNNYELRYSVNGGAWQTFTGTLPLPANSTELIAIPGFNFAAVGDYTIRLAVHNTALPDPVASNDSTFTIIRQLNNPVVNITANYVEDFENMRVVRVIKDSVGFDAVNTRWDYDCTQPDTAGQLRSFINDSLIISGRRSISLDAYRNMAGNQNYFTGTFNMSNYDAIVNEVRMDYDHRLHGRPKFLEGNEVWVRGSDTSAWISIYTCDTTLAKIGQLQNSGTLSITDALRNNGQQFSTSSQMRFGQNDTSLIAIKEYGNGITLDNVRLYVVQNDVELVAIASPKAVGCGIENTVPFTVTLYNGVAQAQNNVQLYYRLDNGTVVNEMLPTIAGKDTVQYTFATPLDLSNIGPHIIDVWIAATGDTYRDNDSLLGQLIRNQPLVRSYPYLENFEAGDGNWYSEGTNNSWAYGTPQSARINMAASGSKAWKTNLTGNYNSNEVSYLYSPCFDVTSLKNPELSFSLAMDIENCAEVLCDGAFMEYTTDGSNWQKLGAYGEGENWYTDSAFGVWNQPDRTSWVTARIDLPAGASLLRLRYVLQTDPAGTFEGLGIDDIMIAEKVTDIPTQIISISPNPTRDGALQIKWNANPGTLMQLMMTDVAGRVVLRYEEKAGAFKNTTNLQTPDFANGIYIIKLVIGDARFEHKVVYQ